MTDTINKALEYFIRRKATLEDEILRRQMALAEVELFIQSATDGRSRMNRSAKRGSETPAQDQLNAQSTGAVYNPEGAL